MRRWFIVKVIFLLLLVAYMSFSLFSQKENVQPSAKETLPTEAFIQKYLLKDNALIRTNVTEQKNVYLSESVGL